MAQLIFVDKLALSSRQAHYLGARLSAPEHKGAQGAAAAWSKRDTGLAVAVFEDNPDEPVGIGAWSGPSDNASVAWWLDRRFRNQRLGYGLVDAFANYLKTKAGVTGITAMPIVPDEGTNAAHEAATKVAKHFRRHFPFKR